METQTRYTYNFEITPGETDGITISLYGNLVVDTSHRCLHDVLDQLQSHFFNHAVIDLAGVNQLDDYGAMVISEICRATGLSEANIQIANIAPDHRKMLDLTDFDKDTICPLTPAESPGILVQLGEMTFNAYKGFRDFILFIGDTFISIRRVIRHPRSLRYGDVLVHMKTTGVDALPVVGLISVMLGLIIAFISSMQLENYGATIYVANLVGVVMVSELSPIMTSILVAGRSGSAYAAEISTMKISEEIDALFVMGFNPNQFLVLPRLLAAMIVVPMLTMLSNLLAITGGAVIGTAMLDLPLNSYITQTIESLSLFELAWGLSKSVVFAVLISISGCLRGFQAKGGAASVGNAATSAVVTSVFLIIFFDSIFAIIRMYWG